jgi:hypothetical protein
MKKWLVGCLVTGLVLLVVGGGLFYWLVWPRISSAGSDFVGQIDSLKKIGEAEQAVKNQTPFTAAADGKLSIAQVSAFVTIQQTIFDKMGPDFALMEEKYKKMGEQGGTSADPSAKDVMGAFADMTGLMAKAKEAQVAGLNVQNMSMEEYRWIRDQVSAALPYIAMDAPAPAPDAEPVATESTVADKAVEDAIAKAQEAAAEAVKESIPGGQQIGDVMQGPESEAARANVELLRPHKELLFKTMTAAWLSM